MNRPVVDFPLFYGDGREDVREFMIVRIVSIAPVVSKYFESIRMTGAIGSFHMIVSIASKARDAGLSAMSLGQTKEFLRVFCKQAT